MEGRKELKTAEERVAFLLDNVPQTRHNYLYLILCYWQVFDGLDIPESILHAALQRATQPETISRARRKVLERHRSRQYLQFLQRMLQEQE